MSGYTLLSSSRYSGRPSYFIPIHGVIIYVRSKCELLHLQVYSESVIPPHCSPAASGVTGTPYNELTNSWGVYFLGFVGKCGYDRILKVRKDTDDKTVTTVDAALANVECYSGLC